MLNILIALTLGFALGVLIFYIILKIWLKKKIMLEPGYKGLALEEAGNILERNGYKIKEKTKGSSVITFINGKSHMGTVLADYIAQKNGKTFVVEVKTEALGADPLEPLTRRQMLEQQHAFNTPHSLLVDVPNAKVMEIEFDFPKVGIQERFIRIVIFLFTTLVVLWFIWMLIQLKLF